MHLDKSNNAIITPHQEHFYNSDNEQICQRCNYGLIRKDSRLECSCGVPIYRITRDFFQGRALTPEDIEGIEPQHNPVYGINHKCVHCNKLIEWR